MTTEKFLKRMHEIECEESDMCKEIHKQLKEICGNTHMIVFDKKIDVDFGVYGSFDAIAVCHNILMARCECGWCDKPIQPYYANKWYFCKMLSNVEKNRFHLDDNPIKDDKITICV